MKKIGKKLLYPPVGVLLLLTVVSGAALIFVFTEALTESPAAYAAYAVSFYTLTAVCLFLARVFPKRYRSLKRKIYENPLGNRYMTDIGFRNHVSLYCSLGINLLYVGINIFSAVLYHSVWFGIFAGYYTILAAMRFLLVRYIHKNELGKQRLPELKCARICACILTTINLVMAGAVPMMLYQDKGFEYHGMLIYAMAVYAFYVTVSAVVELIKYRKYDNPVLSTSKIIKMAAALISMLSLETAMFSRFGDEMPRENQRIMIVATGAGISLIIIAMAVYMILCTTKEIERIKRNQKESVENGK